MPLQYHTSLSMSFSAAVSTCSTCAAGTTVQRQQHNFYTEKVTTSTLVKEKEFISSWHMLFLDVAARVSDKISVAVGINAMCSSPASGETLDAQPQRRMFTFVTHLLVSISGTTIKVHVWISQWYGSSSECSPEFTHSPRTETKGGLNCAVLEFGARI